MKKRSNRSKKLFHEEQKFPLPWIWLVIIPCVVAGIALFAGASGKDFSTEDQGDLIGLIVGGGVLLLAMIGLTWLFSIMRLTTTIDEKGLSFRYPPLVNKTRRILKSEIETYEVRKFKPIKEYGGHGVKKGVKKRGDSYTVSGNTGLQIKLKNGNRLLIGTRRKDAIKKAMDRLTAAHDKAVV